MMSAQHPTGHEGHGAGPVWPEPGEVHPTAVLVHLHDAALWPELNASLARMPSGYSLYVSTSDSNLASQVRAESPTAAVLLVPNQGRDQMPFLEFIRQQAPRHQLVLKLHGKRSPHLPHGDAWRRHLVEGLLPASRTGRLMDQILEDPAVGMVASAGAWLRTDLHAGLNRDRVEHLANRMGRTVDLPGLFPAGAMHWFRPSALLPLGRLPVQPQEFPTEPIASDGTLAHALERLPGVAAVSAGFVLREVGSEGRLAEPRLRPHAWALPDRAWRQSM